MRTLMYADTPFTRQKVVLALDETVVKVNSLTILQARLS